MIDLNEELPDLFLYKGDGPTTPWPAMWLEVTDMRWQPAEPDAGIMSTYIEDYGVTACIGEKLYVNNMTKFAKDVFAIIRDDCEVGNAAVLLATIHRLIDEELEKEEHGYE